MMFGLRSSLRGVLARGRIQAKDQFIRPALVSSFGANQLRLFSETAHNGDNKNGESEQTVPEEFFDENFEADQSFLDVTSAILYSNGIENITVSKRLDWNKLTPNREDILGSIEIVDNDDLHNAINSRLSKISFDDRLNDPIVGETEFLENLGIPEITAGRNGADAKMPFIPQEVMNYAMPYRKNFDFEDPSQSNFIPDSSPKKFRFDRQGHRPCPGKLQRKGMSDKLRCHLIDLDALDFMDIRDLTRFLTTDSEILPRKISGLCSKCQRQVSRAIRRARNLGLLPHLGQLQILDIRPLHRETHFHDLVSQSNYTISKTIVNK